jgi:hypothetical protein
MKWPTAARLKADRPVTRFPVAQRFGHRILDRLAIGVAVDKHPIPALSTKQLVERHASHLGLDIPQGDVNSGDRGHGYRTTPPVRASVKVLPDVLDSPWVLAKEAGQDMVFQVRDDRQLAPVQGRVANTVDALVRGNLQRHEVTARTTDNYPCGLYLHARSSLFTFSRSLR